jgi:tRNA C32,U32 (ribose-2'-O)-methylase TrmJ
VSWCQAIFADTFPGASAVLEAAEQFATVGEAIADCELVIGTTAVKDRDLQHPLRELNVELGRSIRSELTSRTVTLNVWLGKIWAVQ